MASGERKKIGKYDVIEVLGRGGMGIVYKAVDPGIGRTVAIKMTTGALGEDPETLKRFSLEAQSVGRLQHPNIVTIYDLGVEDGHPYLVMELLDGESLESLVRTRRAISLEEKLDIIIQVCNGVQYAHQRNVIHRDLKPANIMILKDGTAKIVDFGIARTGMQKLTRPGQLVGSFQYMSPEQINGANVDSRSDIFSLGILFFQLLTGKIPFEGKDTGETLMKTLHEAAPSLNELLKNCPPGLDDIVQRALAKDPEQRYQTAEELALDLGHILEKWRRERISEYLQGAETAAAQRQWARAKEQLLQVLKRDRQNSRANVRLREVQQEIQKQQRAERAKELLAQAEHALAQSDFAEALNCLNQAFELDRNNLEVIQLRDSIQENRARGDRLSELMQRAELARDAGDLEDARLAIEEGLALDPQNTDFRSMQVVVAQELGSREKQKRMQEFLGEARKQISSRRFAAALEVLAKAESLDPTLTVLKELKVLATTGQQQERQRQDVEKLTAQIEEALLKEDYTTASAKIQEGLGVYPEDRGLLKLKAVVDKQQLGTEKRRYIEQQTAQARRLLDGGKAAEALALLQSALEKYPAERSLDEMLAMVQQSIERTRKEEEKAEVIQRAREAIRRKAYSIAISILEAGRKKMASSEFDELLQFAQTEAENQAKRQKIESLAEEARRLTVEDKYPEARDLLKAALLEGQDQELQLILADVELHIDEFNTGLERAITTAERLSRQDRYAEAIRFLEGQNAQFGKDARFRDTLQAQRQRLQTLQAISALKEQVRDALAKGEYVRARTLCQEFRMSTAATESALPEVALLEKEIEVKQAEVANAKLESALRDARLLVTVRSFDAALGVLENVAELVPLASSDFRKKFDALQTAAKIAFAKQAQGPSLLVGVPGSDLVATADVEADTQLADPDKLQALLVEVSRIAGDYRSDSNLQDAIYRLKQKMTATITILRESSSQQRKAAIDSAQEARKVSAKQPDPTLTSVSPAGPEAPAPVAPPISYPASITTPPKLEPRAAEPAAPSVPTTRTPRQVELVATATPPAEAPPPKPPPSSKTDDKRESAVREALAKARKLQSAGDFSGALSVVIEMLATYPGESRLTQMRGTLEREIELQRMQVRRNDMDDLRRMEAQAAAPTEPATLQGLEARVRALANKYPGDAEILLVSGQVLERIARAAQQRQEKEAVAPPPKRAVVNLAPPPAAATEQPPRRTPIPGPPTPGPLPTPPRRPIAPKPEVVPIASPRIRPATAVIDKALLDLKALNLAAVATWARGRKGQVAIAAALAILVLAIAVSFLGKKSQKTVTISPVTVLPVRVHTSPAGATIRINNEVRGVSDLQLQLPPGNYQVAAELGGYQTGIASLEAKSGAPNSVDLVLQPVLSSVKLSSDSGTGRVVLDDFPAIDLEGGQGSLNSILAGNHKLKFEGPQGSAEFSFSTSTGSPPAVVGSIAAKKLVAVVISNLGSRVRIYCSESDSSASLDQQAPAKLPADGLDLQNVSPGQHQLLVTRAGDQYSLAIDAGQSPTLAAYLQSGKNIGTLTVVTTEDGVTVSVNGRAQKGLTRGGQLRIANLEPKEYTISVSKAGFKDAAPQKVVIRKGEQKLIFPMVALPRVATLSIRGGTPGAQALLDDKLLGSVQADGTLSVANISPGDHSIVLRKDRFESKRLQKHFDAGIETSIAGADAVLQLATGELRVTFSPADAQVTLAKAGESPVKVSNGAALNLPPGSYTLTAMAGEMERTKVVEVIAGQSRSVDLALAPGGMSKWDTPSSWTQEQNAYVHKGGGFVLFGTSPTNGTFSFSVMLQKGKRLQWVLNYTSPSATYVRFQMDENYFYRSIIRNGEETEEVKIPHKFQKKTFQTFQIRVTSDAIVNQVRDGNEWVVLDKFSSPGTNLALGKFGFYLPGKDQIALANFNHYPDLDNR